MDLLLMLGVLVLVIIFLVGYSFLVVYKTFQVLFKNIWLYLFFWLVFWILWVSLIILGIPDIDWSVNFKGLYYLNSFWLHIIVRLTYSGIFLSSFFITKSTLEEKAIKLEEVIKYVTKNLLKKALVDLYYCLVFFWAILLVVIIIFIVNLLAQNEWSDAWIRMLMLMFWTGIIVWSYYFISYYFSSYHCFDKNKFNWATFYKGRKLIKWKFLAAFVGLAFIFVVIIGVFSYFLTHIYGVSFTKLLWMSFWSHNVVVNVVVFILGSMILYQFLVVYSYVYYKLVITAPTKKQPVKKEKPQEESL